MHSRSTLLKLLAAFAAAFFAAQLPADVVETKNGARIVGTITKIDGGNISIKTDYAGDLTIKQSEVVGVATDAPVAVRLASGTVLQGKLSTADGTLRIDGADGQLSTKVEKVAASWTPSGEDPQVIALRKEIADRERKWAYEATVDVTGKSGNRSQLGTAAALRAVLAGRHDKLQFYTAYDRQVTDGTKSADQFKAGSDYASNFSGKNSWYVRDEGGFDRIKDIELYNVAAFGLGYDFIKEPTHLFTGRAGLSFRYEGYKNPLTTDVKSAGLDFGLQNEVTFGTSKLVNSLSIVPSFEDFSNFRLTHSSYYEIPLSNPSWKLRFGLSNDYNSKPGKGVDKMDTAYFTRLVLNWQ
jgi:small nuclear ribonucleoprotein (snRNP)-like protein